MIELTNGTAYKVDICSSILTLVYQGTVFDPVSERIKLKFQANGVISFIESNRISKIEAA